MAKTTEKLKKEIELKIKSIEKLIDDDIWSSPSTDAKNRIAIAKLYIALAELHKIK